jgi:hypothetical protein
MGMKNYNLEDFTLYIYIYIYILCVYRIWEERESQVELVRKEKVFD